MVFEITNARQYREKVEEDLAELLSQIDNSSRAINAVTSTYHLHEWLWAHVLKPKTPFLLDTTTIKNKADFIAWLDANCPYFKLIQDLTNGAKHAFPVHSGGKVAGYGQGPFGIGPYSAPYLLIDLSTGTDAVRYLVASEVIKEAAAFMIDLAKQYGA